MHLNFTLVNLDKIIDTKYIERIRRPTIRVLFGLRYCTVHLTK